MSNIKVKKSDQIQDLQFFIDNFLFDIGYSTVLFVTSTNQFAQDYPTVHDGFAVTKPFGIILTARNH